MNRARRFVKVAVAIAVAGALVGYALYQSRNLLKSTALTLTDPVNGVTVTDPFVVVAGETRNVQSIALNDRPILVDEAGRFNEELLLAPGYTILTVRADDRFGRTFTETRHIIYQPQNDHGTEKEIGDGD